MCHIQVGQWREDDDPWIRHAILSPGCRYVLTAKGREYLQRVLREFHAEVSASKNDDGDLEQPDEYVARNECKICLDRIANCTFLPCKHVFCCTQCSTSFLYTQCPCCRVMIEDLLRIKFV